MWRSISRSKRVTTEEEDVRSHWVAIVLGLTLVAAATDAAPAASELRVAVWSHDFHATLALISDTVACPADVPANTTECHERTVGSGLIVEGNEIWAPVGELGWVEGTYTSPLGVGPPTCPAGLAKPLATAVQLSAASAGELTFRLAEGARCVDVESAWDESQEFTITGGTGRFAGASGTGTVARGFVDDAWGGYRAESWDGTLEAPGLEVLPGHRPGLELDLTPPKLSGAAARTVRVEKWAKSARVTFEVTATDAMDGSVAVSCRPKSGSRFKVGKTRVRCEATDWSGNTGRAAFTVTVKRRR